MINLIEKQYTPSTTELNFLTNTLYSPNFPWFRNIDVEGMDNLLGETNNEQYYFSHNLMGRDPTKTARMGIVNSPHYITCEQIFKNFCRENNIKVKTIFRASLNLTFHAEKLHSAIHVDHNFEHKNFIMYLSDSFGDTFIFDEKYNLVTSVKPELYKGIVFDGLPHAQGFCKAGDMRQVLVFTFI